MSDAIPEGWRVCRLSETLTEEFPGAWGIDPILKPANVSVLRSTNLDDGGHIDYTAGARRYLLPLELNRKALLDGDILLEASGGGPGKPVGRVARFTSPGDGTYASSNFFRTLRPGHEVDSNFLAWLLQWIYIQPSIWQFQQQTTGIINLKYKDYLRQLVALPEVSEQRRIAGILDTADEAVRSTERLIAKLEQARQGFLHDVITRGVDEDGYLRNPLRRPADFIETRVGLIPAGWQIIPTGELFDIQLGKMLDTKSFSGGPRYQYLTNRNVQWGKIILDDLESMPFNDAERSKFSLAIGDVLVCEGGEVGRCAVWRSGDRTIFYQKAIHRLRSKGRIDPGFYVLYMAWLSSINGLANLVGKTSIGHLPQEKLAIVPVRIPELAEQGRISVALSTYDRLIALEMQKVGKLRAVKQGLMGDLFTGRERVVDVEGALA